MEPANKSKKTILSFIRPKENLVFDGTKLLTRLRLNFTHLNYLKFRHDFREIMGPMFKCGKESEPTLHYLFRCNLLLLIELLNDIYAIDSSIKNYPEEKLLNTLLYGSLDFKNDKNQSILKQTIKYFIRSERFSSPLF